MRKVNWSAAIFAAGLAVASPANAQKSADTLRITWRDAIPNVDPYYNQLRSGIILAHQAWDTLLYRDPETFQNKPLLAESYKWIDDTTLEFTLRWFEVPDYVLPTPSAVFAALIREFPLIAPHLADRHASHVASKPCQLRRCRVHRADGPVPPAGSWL